MELKSKGCCQLFKIETRFECYSCGGTEKADEKTKIKRNNTQK